MKRLAPSKRNNNNNNNTQNANKVAKNLLRLRLAVRAALGPEEFHGCVGWDRRRALGVGVRLVNASLFNILDFGGASNDKTDNAKAIKSAWVKACSSKGKNSVLIPKGTYLSGTVLLEGKCNGPITFQLQGLIKAPIDMNSYSRFGL
ncbi:hypothetical protein Scep_011872 [Stephania cephalantha]|uniref:Pectate lyase superfamily protein domain-containing protein n=1 Tax=Stephania cephalantha TaxID=152367 RepID=A0AAP0JE45_9MAGN